MKMKAGQKLWECHVSEAGVKWYRWEVMNVAPGYAEMRPIEDNGQISMIHTTVPLNPDRSPVKGHDQYKTAKVHACAHAARVAKEELAIVERAKSSHASTYRLSFSTRRTFLYKEVVLALDNTIKAIKAELDFIEKERRRYFDEKTMPVDAVR